MRVSIDFKKKEIIIKENVVLSDLIDHLSSTLKDWRKYSLALEETPDYLTGDGPITYGLSPSTRINYVTAGSTITSEPLTHDSNSTIAGCGGNA